MWGQRMLSPPLLSNAGPSSAQHCHLLVSCQALCLPLPQPHEVSAIIPKSHIRRLKLGEVRPPTEGHRDLTPGPSGSWLNPPGHVGLCSSAREGEAGKLRASGLQTFQSWGRRGRVDSKDQSPQN